MPELFCPWDAPILYFYSENPPILLYYSHGIAIIAALLLGLFLFFSKRNLLTTLFLLLTVVFSAWAVSDVLQWATNRTDVLLYFWSVSVMLEILVYIIALYLSYVFIRRKDLSFKKKTILGLLLAPVLILLPTSYLFPSVDAATCNAFETNFAIYYTYAVEILLSIAIIFIPMRNYREVAQSKGSSEGSLFAIGIMFFLLAFSSGNIIGSLTSNWDIAQFGLFGMPIFIGLIAYLIVKYKSFNSKLLGSQALVFSLGILLFSILFIRNIENVRVVVLVTFLLLSILGYLLIRGVKQEVKQRERLQILTTDLETANEKLKGLDKLKTEFLSLASHQLRSPLTAIKGYTSMLLDGSFGIINDGQKQAVDRVFQSVQHLTKVVEDLLNVSKIEQGGMQYTMTPFDFEGPSKDIATDLSITAKNKGLTFSFETDNQGPYTVKGDAEKMRQVILNLIDNSIKYTQTGSIKVYLAKNPVLNKVRLSITDTGMGMTEEIRNSLFQKFNRGEGAKVNGGGSGLGLYLAKQIVEAHNGRVWVESMGPNTGSTFYIELSLA